MNNRLFYGDNLDILRSRDLNEALERPQRSTTSQEGRSQKGLV